ncbi:MAG: DUF2062 domain-containing protein, partial [Planctomycetes bacterium]|nr:DUF2062 domain-containing protein [Planctomycetota bacterium]
MGHYYRKLRKFFFQKILHADDTPRAIALGVGVAMLVAFLPLVGFQTVIAIGLAAVLRANKAVCIPIVWITNPFTLVPIYGACWKLGHWLTSSAAVRDATAVLSKLKQPEPAGGLFDFAFWQQQLRVLLELGKELWIGCLFVGVLLGLVSYASTQWG